MPDLPGRRAPRDVASLRERVNDPGFTPSVRDAASLVALLSDESLAKAAERALARLGATATGRLAEVLEGARAPLRGRIVRALGRVAQAGDKEAAELVRRALCDADPKTQRNAVIALGHQPGAENEQALHDAWQRTSRVELRRSIAASLGKIGGERSLRLLALARADADPELARIGDRAARMVARTASRPERGRIARERVPEIPVPVALFARRGLETLLEGELLRLSALEQVRVAGEGRVEGILRGSLDAALSSRTMLSLVFLLPPERLGASAGEPGPVSSVTSSSMAENALDGEAVASAVARAVASDPARRVFASFTEGPVRYRLAWEEGGHKRALTWNTARAIAALSPALVNDPTDSTWEVRVAVQDSAATVALAPRALEDARFAYRIGDVPAASHPTLAAALARVAGCRADDVVWDPFLGSGAELVERARLGPVRALLGSDIDERALLIAQRNLDAAGLTAELRAGDALALSPPGVTLVVTNPPMGRRAVREKGLADMLDRFVAHMAEVLEPGGRLVWLTPFPARSARAGARAHLTLDFNRTVDMGGFDAEMQRWVKSRQ